MSEPFYPKTEGKPATLASVDSVGKSPYFPRNGEGSRNKPGPKEIWTKASSNTPAPNEIVTNEERLRLAATAGHIGTWEWDPESGVRVLSTELFRIFGIATSDPDDARTWAARVWPEDWPKVQSLMQQGGQAGKMEFEYRYLHPDLGLRWLYCKGCSFQNKPRMFGIVQDITDRKAAEEAAQRLAAIVESSDDAIVSKDLNGTITSWNPYAEKMFGFTAQEMIGRPITTIIPPELRDDETRILATIARGERVDHFETIRMTKSGNLVEVSLTVSPVRDESGRIVGAAKIARDITQRKRTEKALIVTERLAAVGRLAASVAHEINNPLEAITNLIYLAKMASSSNEVQRFLSSAEEQMASVSHLTRQTLGFYRETRGARPVQPSEIVKSLLAVYVARARNKGIAIRQEIRSDASINAVPGEIRQIIANFITNSIDAIHGSGRIVIRVSAARDWKNDSAGIRITVADSGAGVLPAARHHIFEPFFTTKRDTGTGLGLWVCKNIVGNHQGSIRIRSTTALGKSGTTVSVFLPQHFSGENGTETEMSPEEELKKAS
jgi:PAS domain S-box-containing protein